MSAGISGSKTVFSAAMIASVNWPSSSGAISDGGLMTAFRSAAAAGVAASFGWLWASSMPMSLLEEFSGADQCFRERLDLGEGIVERERGSAGGGHSEPLEQRHRAMRSGPDRDARPIDQGRDVMSVRAFHRERDDGTLSLRGTDDAHRVDRGQKFVRVSAKRRLMRADARSPDPLHVIERRPEPDRLHDRRGAGFEAMGRSVVGDGLPGHFLDHLAAALVWRQRFEKFALAVEYADSCWPVDLVPGENVEVGVEFAHVDIEMDRALRTVNDHGNAALMSEPDHILDRRRCPEDIGHLRYRDDLRAIAQRAFERLERKGAVIGDVDPTQDRALALAMEVPRHDVGVMLHHAQHDLIARADASETKAGGDEIDRLGRRAGENDLVVRSGVDEPPHRFPGRLISLGRRVGEIMQSAMHIRVFVLVGVGDPVNDLLRLLS